MVKVRQDAWIEENDTLLADTVLRHVREGSTQLSAFEEVGDALNRTAAACGFRWNAVVRRDYEKELEDAKKERKQAMRVLGKDFKRRGQQLYVPSQGEQEDSKAAVPLSALSLDTVIAYLVRMHHTGVGDSESLRWRHTAKLANDRAENLEQEVEKLRQENKTLRSDYEQFVQIMNRARRLVTLNGEDDRTAPVFKMEQNGNLVSKEPPINH
ncbi:RsfA family transcriptional regulator [Filibacter tadaridae]|uniref:Prespore-specific transcriptional regulator RsfA n=1 Tax=Filibacter tadaridae TaxID=2483811 RepID=A0A3P5WIX1_9BACL|nr:RsfA family transcriptional regulator [Filibacter tadaridae]VDC19369.1 Prespore-specific transcriptional regulator RsfA [Filibacter tadaridae]